MQLEILNIIQFLIFMAVVAIIYGYFIKQFLSWKFFWIMITLAAGVTHTQFYTLTEKADVIQTQNIMLQQTPNSRVLDDYLDNNKPVSAQPTKEETALELEKQQLKSKTLATQIELKDK